MSWFGGGRPVECFGGPADGYVLQGEPPAQDKEFVIPIPPWGRQEAVYEWGRNWTGRRGLVFKEMRDVTDATRWPAGTVRAPGEAGAGERDQPDGPPEDASGPGDAAAGS